MTITEEIAKLLLDEIRKNNNKIDTLNENLIEVKKDISTIMLKTSQLDFHITETKEDIKETKTDLEHLEYTIKGNGTPGLKTKVEVLETLQQNFKDNIEDLKKTTDSYSNIVEEKKQSTAVKVAMVSGAGSGFMALLMEIIGHIWK